MIFFNTSFGDFVVLKNPPAQLSKIDHRQKNKRSKITTITKENQNEHIPPRQRS